MSHVRKNIEEYTSLLRTRLFGNIAIAGSGILAAGTGACAVVASTIGYINPDSLIKVDSIGLVGFCAGTFAIHKSAKAILRDYNKLAAILRK
jgi:hypothetical protein